MGNHRALSDTAEMNRVVVEEHNRPQHKQPTGRLAAVSFVIAFVGLILGWILFGIPSAIATVFAWKAYKADSSDRFLSMVALSMGAAGMVLGAVVSYFVST